MKLNDKQIQRIKDETPNGGVAIPTSNPLEIAAWNSAIDSVLALYAPDGNPDVWRSKIEGLRQNENMPQLVKEPDSMGICPACGANTDSWHFCHDFGTWR